MNNNNQYTNTAYTGRPKFMHWLPPSSGVPGKSNHGQCVSEVGPRRTYWLIPKEKNPTGGWDSIDGFWDAESPTSDYKKETWLNDFNLSSYI